MQQISMQKCGCGVPSCTSYTLSNQLNGGFTLEDAVNIVKAVNAHDALVEVTLALIAVQKMDAFEAMKAITERLAWFKNLEEKALKLVEGTL